ncbi:hypothetical protein RchiOBHm_Chr2g0103511 [Rosa chinensis]|uniref:Uncharacterized protein n=1 Tax=Rosa chinensis TaxID=74649 RepID=A0A2P6RMX8_ROSCH|nr:hypothetical protein RchiOBHm_Chr2g0103511 [Rosa chinensis]
MAFLSGFEIWLLDSAWDLVCSPVAFLVVSLYHAMDRFVAVLAPAISFSVGSTIGLNLWWCSDVWMNWVYSNFLMANSTVTSLGHLTSRQVAGYVYAAVHSSLGGFANWMDNDGLFPLVLFIFCLFAFSPHCGLCKCVCVCKVLFI